MINNLKYRNNLDNKKYKQAINKKKINQCKYNRGWNKMRIIRMLKDKTIDYNSLLLIVWKRGDNCSKCLICVYNEYNI